MNPLLCRVALRNRSPLESFDLTLSLIRAAWRPYLILSTVLLLPLWVLAVVVAQWSGMDGWTAFGLWIIGPWFQGPFTLLTARLLFSPHVSVRSVLVDLPSTFRATLLGVVAWFADLVMALISLGLGWPFGRTAWLFLREVAMLERLELTPLSRRTLSLATARPGFAFMGVCMSLAVAVWMPLAAEVSGQAIVGFVLQLGEPFGSLSNNAATPYLMAGIVVSQPVLAAYRLVLYIDVRTQLEGWDLQNDLRAAAVAS